MAGSTPSIRDTIFRSLAFSLVLNLALDKWFFRLYILMYPPPNGIGNRIVPKEKSPSPGAFFERGLSYVDMYKQLDGFGPGHSGVRYWLAPGLRD